jgi:hypothetical protein
MIKDGRNFMNIKYKIIFLNTLLVIFLSSSGETSEDNTPEKVTVKNMSKVNKWEEEIEEIARTWDQSATDLKKEAREFIRQFRIQNPHQEGPKSIRDLIILKKPSRNWIGEMIGHYNSKHPEAPKVTEKDFGSHTINQKFLVRQQ